MEQSSRKLQVRFTDEQHRWLDANATGFVTKSDLVRAALDEKIARDSEAAK